MKTPTLIQAIVTASEAQARCTDIGNTEWADNWTARISQLCEELPSGSGFDAGTTLEFVETGKVVFATSFHHMDENGYYDGWTDHKITVRPTWEGINITVSGKDRNGIKDYIAETFHHILTQPAPEAEWRKTA